MACEQGIREFLSENQIGSIVIHAGTEVGYGELIEEIKVKTGTQLIPRELMIAKPIIAVGAHCKSENGPFAITSITLPSRDFKEQTNSYTCWFDKCLP